MKICPPITDDIESALSGFYLNIYFTSVETNYDLWENPLTTVGSKENSLLSKNNL
jgi:hypothetical protein